MLIKQNDCCLLVIDVQARLLPATYDPAGVAERCRMLLRTCREADIPILVLEHYPRGIGHTAEVLASLIEPGEVMEKIHFSCFSEPSARRRIRDTGMRTMVVAGMEAHVCLGQTALDLIGAGYRVIVSSDATVSRRRLDHETALRRLSAAGAEIATTAEIADGLTRHDPAPPPAEFERVQ
jgi:nicotinamidase-related amidase